MIHILATNVSPAFAGMPVKNCASFSFVPTKINITSVQSPWASMYFRSKRRSGSPVFIGLSCCFSSLKPFPFKETVSTPTWINSSSPVSLCSPIACLLSSEQRVTVPLHGATMVSSSGRMTTPPPIMQEANVSSFASLIGKILPLTGAFSSICLAAVFFAVCVSASLLSDAAGCLAAKASAACRPALRHSRTFAAMPSTFGP